MKRTALGMLVVLGLLAAAAGVAEYRSEALAQGIIPPAPATGTELIVTPTSLGEKGQMLTVVDPRQRVISVYHIDMTGKIALKGVRNIQWDMQMAYLNNEPPYPNEIRSLLEQRQGNRD